MSRPLSHCVETMGALSPGSSQWTVFEVDVGLPQPLSIDAFLYRGFSVKPLVLVTAGVHGDEYEGPAAIADLSGGLSSRKLQGSLIAIPVANPMAFAAAQRTSASDGLNLARTFPGKPDGKPTERLAAALFDGLVRHCDYLIDLHSGGVEYVFLPLAGFYGSPDVTNPSYQSARCFGLPVLWQLPATQGVLSYEATQHNIVSIGMEYLGAGQLSVEGAHCYAEGVLSCLALWDVSPEDEPLPATDEVFSGDWQLASVSGLFRSSCQLGDEILPGEPLAEILDLKGTVLQRFVAPLKGRVLALRSKSYLREGDWAVLLGIPTGGNYTDA